MASERSYGRRPPSHRAPATHRVRLPLPVLILVATILLSLGASTTWRLMGNSLYFTATPSMCPSLCVGSLVVDTPLGTSALHVGELITFHPPGVAQVFTHRIYKIADGGQIIQTKGTAVPRPDPWNLTRDDVVGVTVASVWGVGWFYRALSFMAVGAIGLLFVRRYIAARSRRDMDRLFATILIAVPLAIMKPLVRSYLIGATTSTRKNYDVVHIINTGLIPSRFEAIGGTAVAHVASGQSITVVGPLAANVGVQFRQTASLTWQGWSIAVCLMLVPFFSFLFDVAMRHYRPDTIDPEDVTPGVVTVGDALALGS